MPYHLVTVDHVHPTGFGLQIAPTVPLRRLVAESGGSMAPRRGDGVELCLPDGRIRHETIGQFGVDGWRHEGQFYTASNPEDPEITVAVAGELRPEDVPPGTEIWLLGREAGPSVPEAGPCSFCQMKEARARGLIP